MDTKGLIIIVITVFFKNSYLFDIIVYFILLCCLLWGIKKKNYNIDEKEFLKEINGFRGFFAVEVLLGHVVQYQQGTALRPLSLFMMCSVGFFFFVSSYNMTYKLRSVGDYLDASFIIRKYTYLFSVTMIIYLFCCLVSQFTKSGIWYFNDWKILALGYWDRTNWYIWVLMFFYLLFYLVARVPQNIRSYVLLGVVLVITVLESTLGWQERYFISSMCFPFGMIYSDNIDWFKEKKNRILIIFGVILGIILGGLTLIFDLGSIVMCICKNFFCISVILVIVMVIQVFTIDNRLLRFLNSISLEIFLLSFLWISVFQNWGFDYRYVLCGSLVLSVLVGHLFHPIFKLIRDVTNRFGFR